MAICRLCYADKSLDWRSYEVQGVVIKAPACRGCHFAIGKAINFLTATGSVEAFRDGVVVPARVPDDSHVDSQVNFDQLPFPEEKEQVSPLDTPPESTEVAKKKSGSGRAPKK